MAREDLEILRDAIIGLADSMGLVSRADIDAINYYGEDRLRATLAMIEGISEAEAEIARDEDDREQEIEDEERERREILADYGYEDYDDDYGQDWEVEITVDYGDD